MKKIALTSLLAVVAVSGAHAANTLDGNPLYRPAKGHFYSETALSSHSMDTNTVELGETFGYGITDRLAVKLSTSVAENNWFDGAEWDDVTVGVDYRIIGEGAWKLDVYGEYGVGPMWADHGSFLDKEDTVYGWVAGVRGGYVTEDWTLAAHASFLYLNTESFNWGDDDPMWANHVLNLGIAGHWTMSDTWSLIASADYNKVLDHFNEAGNEGWWDLSVGVNYNIDDTKYVGAFVNRTVDHVAAGEWNFADGFGFGLKFGIDF